MQEMKPIHFGALLLLGAIWGASFLFISAAAHEFGPIVLMFLRVLFAGLVMLLYTLVLRNLPDWRKFWKVFLIVGFLNSALPFTLIAYSELKLSPSLASILNSTTPLFTAMLAAFWGKENLSPQKLLGVVLGIVGVSVLVGGNPIALNTEILLAVGASLVAAFSYGMGTVYAARTISGKMSGVHATVGQMLGAALVLAIPAATSIPPAMPNANAMWAFLALTLVCTCFAYLIYFYLLQNVGATRTASVTFLVPVFGTFWGILFNKDPYNLWMFLGMAIIFASVGLVMGLHFGKAKVAETA